MPWRSQEWGRRSLLGARSIAGQVFLVQAALVILLIAAAATVFVLDAHRDSVRDARQRSMAVALAFARAPGTADAMTGSDPTAVLQPRVEELRKQAGVDLVVAFSPQGIRYTHPDPQQIGRQTLGPGAPPEQAYTHTVATGLGPTELSVVPVPRADGPPAGSVAVGITTESIRSTVQRQLPAIFGSAAVALALALISSALLGRRVRRQTRGLEPSELTRMYEHHDAVLHAVREGVLVLDAEGRLLLANDEARRLLGLPAEAEGRQVSRLGLEEGIGALLASGEPVTDKVHPVADRLLAVNVRRADVPGGRTGSVATLRDSTELQALAGRAEVARERLKLLYDASVRIGTTLEVPRTAQELAEAAAPRFADLVTVDLAEEVLLGKEPTEHAVGTLRRTAVSGIHDPVFPLGELLRYAAPTPQAQALEQGEAVLEPDLNHAPGWRHQGPAVVRRILGYGIHSLITVPVRARGVTLGLVNFWRSQHPEPFEQDDAAVAEELVARAALCIDNARRYTREHTLAATLQRSLLPRGAAEQDALEVAHRYLPAQSGVGGDWFDVIPLSGARVALVVGDVVGHGLHAAATMGRLRIAVHNFSALDLPPEELLAHLDELVRRVDHDQPAEDNGTGMTGATCLYVIYDPADGCCTIAAAGHLPPALVYPDGTVTFPEMPVSPPLGLGGEPVETVELHLPAGSRLALFTDGLVEDRDRDIDAGLSLLRRTLAGAQRDPKETCQTVLDAMLPTQPIDDIVLLVARTRLLGPSHMAQWDVPADPAQVGVARTQALRRLQAWGLEELSFTTELILSELVTNAIRYGAEPIRVRLLRDRSLICEVSDASSTSPHPRRAKPTDEGGRGLFLVASLANRWGIRYTPDGKIIWAEQRLDAGEPQLPPGMWDDLAGL
ncbi:SpoIIE family protein phosphatase [Streptomyces sp. GD-15H]|uniref:SpoIIE family protein phosphatase n=1 Tax=Streptomyces sp. GD-15H TaxID=3129112 RepID=UPI00324BB178